MEYTCYHITCAPSFSEILIAELVDAGFDAFEETPEGINTYAETARLQANLAQSIIERYRAQTPITYETELIAKKNWNEEWEKNVPPVTIQDKVRIRAQFHAPDKNFPYEIIITPKMSFGTGHHATTRLMIEGQLNINHRQKSLMDAGCGTGVLSIMASRLGARSVLGFDVDAWSVENAQENVAVNACSGVTIQLGSIASFANTGSFDIILANINKNILLTELPMYDRHLAVCGHLLLSGFHLSDVGDIAGAAQRLGLTRQLQFTEEDWAAVFFAKM